MQQQATYIKVVGIERTATGKSQQENRKWLRWVENQLLARGVNISRASSSATASAPAACKNCTKGKGKGKGTSNKELLSEYQRLAEAVTLYVDHTGRGRRPDQTWGTSVLAAQGAIWQTSPENEPTGQCHHCGWWSTSTLWRCSYCQQELCLWCSSWDRGVCHCGRLAAARATSDHGALVSGTLVVGCNQPQQQQQLRAAKAKGYNLAKHSHTPPVTAGTHH